MEVVRDKVFHLKELYDYSLTRADERVKDWFLMQGVMPTLALTALYLVVVWALPKFMEHRKPLQARLPIALYNFMLIILNLHICTQIFYSATRLNYSYSCQPVNYSNDPDEMRIARALWWFYFSKFLEMMDTIFFILRKKNNQVSFLHVYHHASMFPIWWIGVKWVAGGQSFFGAMVNSFIHVIMYTYYGIAALGPQYQKYLWWKRYLTKLQLLQFFIGMVYGVQSLVLDCDYPKWMQWVGLFYGITIITLFVNFYVQAYIKPKAQSAQIQFVTGIVHAAQSVIWGCDFPEWMHWALIFYAFSILMLFLNFYFHAYIKASRLKAAEKVAATKSAANGHAQNGHVESKKAK